MSALVLILVISTIALAPVHAFYRQPGEGHTRRCHQDLWERVLTACGGFPDGSSGFSIFTHCCTNRCPDNFIRMRVCPKTFN
ncbi:unnamed protein product [Caenorhabditis sp. 36 PRJEB53466]|nr:unnamed protein product [Caenorhabditis sp. 36 PRJEB53466]